MIKKLTYFSLFLTIFREEKKESEAGHIYRLQEMVSKKIETVKICIEDAKHKRREN